jgi:chemotaxis protein methyltransferase CheR
LAESFETKSGTFEASEATFDALRDWVEQYLGIHFTASQHDVFRGRIESLCRDRGCQAVELLARVIDGDVAATSRLAEAVSTNYTHFFREPETFERLLDTVFPALPRDGEIRIWSAAASSGEEAFSIAASAITYFGLAEAQRRVRILGTDISERQIKLAEEATYHDALITDAAERMRPWLLPASGGRSKVEPTVRSLCTFRRFNLTRPDWPFEQAFSVIFLRNVLYYFEPALRVQLVEACFRQTMPGGWLVTSVTEPLHDLAIPWSKVAPGVFRKAGR